MSKSQSKIPSPARSQGAITPRRPRTRRTLSSASPAQSEARLSTVVEQFVKSDKLVLSPMKRRSVLPDDTAIEAPRRASWYKRLEGSSRDVLEALDTNKMTDDLMLEQYEFEVEKDDKQSQSVQQNQSSDSDSVASIVVPQRRLFNQKKQTQGKFGDIMGSRKSLGKTNIEDKSIEDAPKILFNKGTRNKPVFPAALLNSTNKTINKTDEPETNKPTRPNLFGQAGGKRKNKFTDFVVSDSEEDSEVQHKVFVFKKNNNKRISLGTRNRRMPSLTPSMTTEIDIDDWNLLPSSTMIGSQENSSTSDKHMEQVQDENQDDTLTEDNASLNRTKQTHKSMIQNDENDKTLTNENIEDGNNGQNMSMEITGSKKVYKTHNNSKTKLNVSGKDMTSQHTSINQASNISNAENVEPVVLMQQQNNANDRKTSLEDKMAEIHRERIDIEESRQKFTSYKTQENICEQTKITSTTAQEIRNDSKTANNTKQNENLCEKNKTQELDQSAQRTITNCGSKELAKINIEEEIETNAKAKKNHQGDLGETEKGNNKKLDASQDQAKKAIKSDQGEDLDKSEKEKEQKNHQSQAARKSNQGEDIDESEEKQEVSELEKEPNEEDQEVCEMDKEQSEEEQYVSEIEKEHSEEEQEQSEEEEQSEAEQELSEEKLEQSEEELEPSLEEQKSKNISDVVNQDQDMDEKDKSDEGIDQEDRDEDMEEMVWNDNDGEQLNDASEEEIIVGAEQAEGDVEANRNKAETSQNLSKIKQNSEKSKNVTNKSQTIVAASLNNDQMEEGDVVEETLNNSTQDTTGRNRNKEVSKVELPEAVLQNMTNDNESFRPIGRSTTFRKSKSVYDTMHVRHSLAPVQESTLGSGGSRNSSTEGSEWDSHRTTRKTIRQTLGKEYTTRKSLRALVMEQSAKRQTELYNKNTSKFDKTTNKTVTEDNKNEKNASKINKTKNKSVIENGNSKNASTINKKTMIEDAYIDNATKINKSQNETVLEDIRITSNRKSGHLSPYLRPLVHGNSTHHVPDPLISEHQASYHKSLHDIKEPKVSQETLTNPEGSVNIPIPENDSGPEISLNASYGQGMTASGHEDLETSDVEMLNKENTSPIFKKENSRRVTSVFSKSINNSDHEVLDYEASEQVISGLEDQKIADHDESGQNETSESENEEEIEQSEREIESEPEDSQQEIEPDSEHEESEEEAQEIEEQEQSQNEIESDQESQGIEQEPESEDQEESEEEAQEIEEQEQSQEQIESDQESQDIEQIPESEDQEESEEEDQEIKEQEQSQEEIESDQESQDIEQEPESEDQSEKQAGHNSSQESLNEQESEHDISGELENENSDQEDFISALNSKYKTPERRGVSRIVFDTNMMSVDGIDFEGISRQTDNDITDNTAREAESDIENSGRELSRGSEKRVSEPIDDVSLPTKKAMLIMRMEKVAQESMERKQKYRDQLEKLLNRPDNYNSQYIGLRLPQHCIRRPPVPRKPKTKPKPTGINAETLPKTFAEDLMYKPPKRFKPASASWITKRLYNFLETKLEPKYDYRARVRAEELVQSLFSFSRLVRRRDVAPSQAVDELKREMARLRIVQTHFDFYNFLDEFMPTELILKVKPDMVNKIPFPKNVFSDILPSRAVVE